MVHNIKTNMELKTIIGNNAYWTINKSLAKEIGLEATLVLQHLIDLDENYFDGEFWQTGTSIQESTFLSKHKVSKAITTLSNVNYIEVENKVPTNSRTIAKVYHFTILKSNVRSFFDRCQSNNLTDISKESLPTSVKEFNRVDKEKLNKEKRDKKNTNKRVLTKLIELYPKNRVNNQAPILKYLENTSDANKKIILTNLPRYLDLAGSYVKNLRNYLEHECWTDVWLSAEETKNKKQNINNIDTKDFDTNY